MKPPLDSLACYIDWGLRLFPVIHGAKRPLIKDWPNQATNDFQQIAKWNAQFPGCNWALLTGRASGVIVFDIDEKPLADGTLNPDGGLSLALLMAKFGKLPETPVQHHGLGYHLFFKYPTGVEIRSLTLAEGVEVKADRHAILLAPSISRSLPYLWDADKRPDRLPFADLPAAWLDPMTVKPQTVTRDKTEPITGDDAKWAAGMLEKLGSWRADGYYTWVETGLALSCLGETGLQLWEKFSQRSPKYRPGECEKKWATFKPGDGIGLGSLAHWAREDGAQ
jgi:hypothetical protein